MRQKFIYAFFLSAALALTAPSCAPQSYQEGDTAAEGAENLENWQGEETPDGFFRGREGDDQGLEFNLSIHDFDESFIFDSVASYNEGVADEIKQRQAIQAQTADDFQVFKDFSFSHELEESGITFRHRIVNDAGIDFNFNHYDHGNGIAVADVNGDGLLDVYFVTQIGENQLWANNGDGTFRDITDEAGVGLERKVSITASFADIDNDGDADLFVTTLKHGNTLFENGGKGVFRNISAYSGLNYRGHSSGAVFFDYDNDGLLDLLVTNVGGYTTDELGENGYFIGDTAAFSHDIINANREVSIFYKNMGMNKFKDVTKEVGLVNDSWSGDATVIDLNHDRYPDLYVLNMEGNDTYYENVKGEKFVDKTAEIFRKTSGGAMGVKFFDYDNDLDLDLYVTDMHSDMGFEDVMDSLDKELMKSDEVSQWIVTDGDEVIYGNAFYENDGEGNMVEKSTELNLENYWPWGVSVADVNADGYDDIFVTASMNYLYKYVPNLMMLNNKGGGFLNAEYLLAIEPRQNNEIEKKWFDLDCAKENKDHLECKDRTGEVSIDRGPDVTVMGSLGSRSSVIFDVDGDGDLDIITNEFNDEPLVLISNLAQVKDVNYIEVALEGASSNRDGLGSFITVFAGENAYIKYNDGSSGYLSHSRMPLYFGLGDSTKVDKVEVEWPSGQISVLENIDSINTLITVAE